MKVLVLDNYDSFTYNLVQYIQEILEKNVDVFRNDQISLDAVNAYDVIILSPGPGVPEEAGIMPKLIERYASSKKILGVCLGHQAIGEAFGGELHNLAEVLHGIETPISIKDQEEVLFQDLPDHFIGGRYHSWVVKKENLPKDFIVTAEDDAGVIMGIRHKEHDVRGVQFHPESIMTQHGMKMLENYLNYCKDEIENTSLGVNP
ncbi:MAG: aminodeoxychorismate/anthranilate synthase component II [Bacteroidota bacterium]